MSSSPLIDDGRRSRPFLPGGVIPGFDEATNSDYRTAQLIPRGRFDWERARIARPWVVPILWKLEITPRIVARLPLLVDDSFAKPPNLPVVNSARLAFSQLLFAIGEALIFRYVAIGISL